MEKKDPLDAIAYARRHTPPVKITRNEHGETRWEFCGEHYTTSGPANRARWKYMLEVALRTARGGLDGLLTYAYDALPLVVRQMAEAMEKSAMKTGKPRGGWKWSAESRKRLSDSRKGQPRKQPLRRGYPPAGFTEAGAFEIPATGHRFTVTRTDLERLLALILP